jgi:hypothetical protein
MAAPKYLTGDKAGIQEFLDKFDVSIEFWLSTKLTISTRYSCSIAMVSQHALDNHVEYAQCVEKESWTDCT